MPNVLIAGCGYLGTALAESLCERRAEVWGLRRNPEGLPGRIHPYNADLEVAESLTPFPAKFDYVFYTAGASNFTVSAYRAAYVDGVNNLLEALEAQGQEPKRILFTSTTGVYAQSESEWVDESSPTEPEVFSGKVVLEGEKLFEESRFDTVVLRLGGIYGPARTGLIDRVRSEHAQREERDRHLNLIHRDDAVGALAHLMGLEQPAPLYLGVDGEPQVWNELVTWVAKQLGMPEPKVGEEPQSNRPFRNRRCSNALLRESGYVFKFASCRDGYLELIQAKK